MKIPVSIFLISFFSLIPATLSAHDYPMTPVELKLKIEPGEIYATLKTNSIYWTEELLKGAGNLGAHWPEKASAKAEELINSYLQIFSEGVPIKGSLLNSRLIEEPFHPDDTYILFRVTYKLPSGTKNISGGAEFFKEYWQEERAAHGQRVNLGTLKGEPEKLFVTNISIAGHKDFKLSVPIDNPNFSIPIAPNLLPRSEFLKESFADAMVSKESGIWLAIFLLAALLFLPKEATLQYGIGLFTFMSLTTFFLKIPSGTAFPTFAPLVLLFLMGVISAFSFQPGLWLAALSAGGALWGILWQGEYSTLSANFPAWLLPKIIFLSGKILFGVIAGAFIGGVFWAYRKRQSFLSESMAPTICRTHARFAAIFLLVLSLLEMGRLLTAR